MTSGGLDMATLAIYQRSDEKWAWRLRADNNEIIAVDGSQGYEKASDAKSMATRIIEGEFADATVVTLPLKS